MSTLTDFFTSLANKIRSKTGSSAAMTPSEMVDAIDDIATPLQTKTVTAGTSATTVTPDTGYALSSVTVNPTPSQTKSATPSTSAQTISPDSGNLLSSVSVAAISPQRSLGTAATGSGIDGTGPYVYMPYGWWPEYSGKAGSSYTYMTAAQAVAACPKQEKTSTPTTRSATAATVTPDSGKLLSKVTVNTNSVPNSNSGTKTITSSDANWYTGNVDMGETNTFRYVNAVAVYNKGKADGSAYVSGHIYVSTSLSESNASNKVTCTSWSGGLATYNVPVGTYVLFLGGMDDSFLFKSFAGTVVYNSGQQKAGSTRALVFVLTSTDNSKLEIWMGNGSHTHASYRLA